MILNEEPLCRHCWRAGAITVATDVDHILPLKQGGTNHRTNLQPLCHECHSRKTMSEIQGKAAPDAPGDLLKRSALQVVQDIRGGIKKAGAPENNIARDPNARRSQITQIS